MTARNDDNYRLVSFGYLRFRCYLF